MRNSYILLCSLTSFVGASTCPFYGQAFPAPKQLAADAAFQGSIEALEASITQAIISGNDTFGPIKANDTYSIQIFSTQDKKTLLDFHRRGPNIVGDRPIDGDSIYRIGSVTKLYTVYLLLLHLGDGVFEDPVTKYLPELSGKGNWDEIRVGAVAGFISGITAEMYGADRLNGGLYGLFPGVFPALDQNEIPPCQYGISGCSRKVFIDYLLTRRPIHLPNTTPAYSNTAFGLLGLILESATGLTYEESMQRLLNEPLGLKSTYSLMPKDSTRGVIFGNISLAGWDLTIDEAGIGMGAIFSTPNEVTAVGRAILASSLLPSNTTRAWMKPTTHTSSLFGSVGRGWEIFRATLGAPESNRVVDLFTKSGNVLGFGGKLVLIPDYDVGFTVLTAGAPGTTADYISGVIIDELLPALENAARKEAKAHFTGTYVAKGGLNTSITLSSQPNLPGLSIDQWISNGTDVMKDVLKLKGTFQMYPTNIEDDKEKTVSWRSSWVQGIGIGPLSACPSWFALDRPAHGIHGIDEFVFHLDNDGKAVRVEPKVLKVVLERQETASSSSQQQARVAQ